MHPRLHTTIPKHAANRACYGCGSASRKEYVDLGIVIEYEGKFVLCGNCVTACAQTIGLLSAQESKKLSRRVAELEAQIEGLTETEGRHERLVAALGDVNLEIGESVAGLEAAVV